MPKNDTNHDAGRSADAKERRDGIIIHIDHKQYTAPKTPMNGLELRALAEPDIGVDHHLYQVMPGPADDDLVEDAENVALKNGMHFYSAPKTINPGEL